MVGRDDGKLVLWPRYFDKALSRSQGRRLPEELCIEDPRAGDIAEAARSLGLNPVYEKDAAHPGGWWEKQGRVLVDAKWSKEETLEKVASRL